VDCRKKHERGREITALAWHPQKCAVVYCDNHGYFGEWSDIANTPVSHNVSSLSSLADAVACIS